MTDPASQDITALPLTPYLDEIANTLSCRKVLMLHAEPGAGKTTLVPRHLLDHASFRESRILLLEPRRLAVRAAAERIAALRGETLGETVGLRTRLETILGRGTRLEVVTEGVLTRIIQNDPLLSRYGLVIFDEFHERNLPGDLAFAFTWECREVYRPDLKIMFMSATPPAAELKQAIGETAFLSVPGRSWPVTVSWRPPRTGETPWAGAARLVGEARGLIDKDGGGDVLVFLPGFREIRLTREVLLHDDPGLAADVEILHGSLAAAEQRRILAVPEKASRRIILSTNIAETSLTIPGVRAVVDSGLERRVRFHPRTGMDHWETGEISAASARQRAGRAGRQGPGFCLCWWHPDVARRDFSLPEILEADLAPLLLETALWGAASPLDLLWITQPPAGALQQAAALLRELSLLDARGCITEAGRQVATLGLHPRLGRMIMTAKEKGWLATAAVIAAILAEGDPLGGNDPDFRERLSAWVSGEKGAAASLRQDRGRRIAREIRRIMQTAKAGGTLVRADDIDPGLAGRLLLLAYPDRLAQRTGGGCLGEKARLILVTGRAATIQGELGNEEFLVAADLDGGATEARVLLAAPLSRSEVESGLAGEPRTVLRFSWEGWSPRFRTEIRLGRLLLGEKPGMSAEPADLRQAVRERLAEEGLKSLPWNDVVRHFHARCLFAGKYGGRQGWPDFSFPVLLEEIEEWLFPFGNWQGSRVFSAESIREGLLGRLGWQNRRLLDELAPEMWELPSGTKKRLDYESGGIPVLAARLQEFFGCRETPLVCGEPVLLHLLSPAGRPVQVTRDLDGFWERIYPAVKKELMGRYPRHFWPDDPRIAEPMARAKKRRN